MTIKAILFEVNDTVWSGKLDPHKWGKGDSARDKQEDNLKRDSSDKHVIRDVSNRSHEIRLFDDIPKIIHDIKERDIPLGFVSKDSSRKLCDRALYYFEYPDENHQHKPIIKAVKYDETGSGDYTNIFKKIKGWASAQGDEILFFDSHEESQSVHRELDVCVEIVNRHTGVTWEIYNRALQKYGNGNGNGNGDNGNGNGNGHGHEYTHGNRGGTRHGYADGNRNEQEHGDGNGNGHGHEYFHGNGGGAGHGYAGGNSRNEQGHDEGNGHGHEYFHGNGGGPGHGYADGNRNSDDGNGNGDGDGDGNGHGHEYFHGTGNGQRYH
ncbi:hypothetical protein E1B28_003717 [Marasmius oreades]|uniref:Uncharacterized protein n=1 Tax=Marasmius oreades TaxID=181124 RepID=A0A9P8AB74_9AGAR|nr:uncharacterized protein E1B28_003717 [Marasmius oreades]KAG7096269.1 hypothetical protein E1B28_003717 [Marasmius oreades]